jgi:hypothetical protein
MKVNDEEDIEVIVVLLFGIRVSILRKTAEISVHRSAILAMFMGFLGTT